MNIHRIRELVAGDMAAVDRCITRQLHSEVVLINQLGGYIVNSGGKRLRPALVLLSAGANRYTGERHIDLAAIVEFIHTATLLHDDVVDASNMRRGRESANLLWGNEASVLVGDYLYSRAFQMMVEVGEMRIMEVLAETTNTIAEGEVMQLVNCQDPDTTEECYLEVIRSKTAKLFEAASRLGAILADAGSETEAAMAAYGAHLGTAFQLIDDALDYSSSSEELGKNIGDDLAEGKPTLPLLYAMWHGSAGQAAMIRQAIEHGDRDNIDAISATIESSGGIAYTARLARAEADQAIAHLECLPGSEYRQALRGLAEFSVSRHN